ncbi:MAG: enoyl-CoA hydratase/isomerase family protein [Acidimicrobiaceae bacterium]|nr:enoyl-CoA hydratase/isomerase family protein [Acidimicrobiaceae bacterium]
MADERPIEEQVHLDYRGQVAWITIDRPEAANALNPQCRDRVRDILNGLNTSHRARCAVITGAGDRFFCTGADLRHSYGDPDRSADVPDRIVGDPRRMMLDGQHSLFAALLDCDVPVLAAVNGTAAGMGAHLALACDLVIAGDGAKFVEVFARRGLVPDALGAWLLPRIVGVRRTMELFLLAEDLPADRARDYGLVNRVVPHDEVQAAAAEWAERLASGPSRSFALTKWLVNRSLDADRATMAHDEAVAVELNTATQDAAEGVAAFQERRPPEWKGY